MSKRSSPKLGKKVRDRLYIASGSTYPELAERTADYLGVEVGDVQRRGFTDGERYVRLGKSARGKHVVVMQTHAPTESMSINDSVVETLLMVDAAKRASARAVTVVAPYLAYARQDRKAKGREPISSKRLLASLEQAGANRIVTVDAHAPQIQGFVEVPFDHMTAERLIRKALKRRIGSADPSDYVIVSPDAGRAKAAEEYAKKLGTGLVHITKTRDSENTNVIKRPDHVEGVGGRHCFVIDDMIDTAGTLASAAQTLANSGAKDVVVAATHGLFSGDAFENLTNAPIDSVIVTDTRPMAAARLALGDSLEVLPIHPLLGQTIGAIVSDGSVSEVFNNRNYS